MYKKRFPCIWQAVLLLLATVAFIFIIGFIFSITMLAFALSLPLNEARTLDKIFAFRMPLTYLIAITLFISAVLFFSKNSFKEYITFGKVRSGIILPVLITVAGSVILQSELNNAAYYAVPMADFFYRLFFYIKTLILLFLFLYW